MKSNRDERLKLLKHLTRTGIEVLNDYLEGCVSDAKEDLVTAESMDRIRELQGQIKADKKKLQELKTILES